MPEKKDRYEVVMAGSGGQGLIVSGVILAQAAIVEGRNVVQTQSYGIASRGGFSSAEVIIDEGEILYQQVQEADLALALTEEAMDKYAPLAESGTPVFYDTSLLAPRTGKNFYGFPFTEMGGKLGHVGMANMIALGAMSAVTGMVSLQSLETVIRKRFSGKTAEMNIKALQAGVALTESGNAEISPGTSKSDSAPAGVAPAPAAADESSLDKAGQWDFQVAVNSSICKQCGFCKEVCNKDVFEESDSYNSAGYKPMAVVRGEKCIGCLQCLMVCPDFAISIEPSPLRASKKSRRSEQLPEGE